MGRLVRLLLLVSALLFGDLSVAAAAAPERVLPGAFHRGTALALDPSGHRHVVSANGAGDLWYATDRTGTWTSQRILAAVPGSFAWTDPAIATDDDGRIHVVAVQNAIYDTPGSTGGIFYTSDAGRPRGDFGPRVRITPPMMTTPSLRVEGGVRYLAYARCLCLPGQKDAPVFFKTDRGGRWRTERIADRGFEPSLRVDSHRRASIVFSDRLGLRLATARTKVGDFSGPMRVPGTLGLQGSPSLALGPGGRERIAWATWSVDPLVLFVKHTTTGWSRPARVGRGSMAELSIDAQGRSHVVLGGGRVVHRWLAGGDWERHVLARDVDVMAVDIRAFGMGASIAWSQDTVPRGVWVGHD
jgi:hypothetical protein